MISLTFGLRPIGIGCQVYLQTYRHILNIIYQIVTKYWKLNKHEISVRLTT